MLRAFSLENGLSRRRTDELVLAVSELAANLVRHSTRGGTVSWRVAESDGRRAIEVECTDSGPGISNIAEAMEEGFSTHGGLGGGLSGARRLADKFEIESQPSATTVRIAKWLP
jgi:serine/threonine-protein kinase RsbT